MAETVAVVELQNPVEAHGEKLIALRFREPRGKDFKKISQTSMERPYQMLLDFAAQLADVPPSTMDELHRDDVAAVIEAVGPFMPGYHATGPTS